MSNDIANMGSGLNTTGIEQASAALKELLSASQQIGQMAKDFQAVGISINVMNVQLSPSIQNIYLLGAGFEKTENQASKATGAVSRLIAKMKENISVMDVIDMADNWGQMSYRIQQTVNSQAEYNTVMARTAASARETSRDVDEVRELYLQVGESIQGLGYSLLESMDLTDSFSLLLKTNSASAEESAAATNAYAAALQKGSVDAKDWETMLAAMPSLVDQVADSTGMSAEEIKRLGSEGKLALQDLNQGMLDSLESTRALSTEMPDTVRGALTNVMSGVKDFVGAQNQALGVTQLLAGGLNLLAENIDVLGKVAAAVGVVMGARYVASLQSSAGAMVAAAAQTVRLQVATVSLAATISPVSALLSVLRGGLTLLSGGMALLGGPVGLVVTALAGATAAFFAFKGSNEEARKTLVSMGDPIDELTQKIAKMSEEQRASTLIDLNKDQISSVKEADAAYEAFRSALMNAAAAARFNSGSLDALSIELDGVKASGGSFLPIIERISAAKYVKEGTRDELVNLAGDFRTLAQVAATAANFMERVKGAMGIKSADLGDAGSEDQSAKLLAEADAVLAGNPAYKSRARALQEVIDQQNAFQASLDQLVSRGLGTTQQANNLQDSIDGAKERIASMSQSASGGAQSVDEMTRAFQNSVKSLNDRITAERLNLEILQEYGLEAKKLTAIDREVIEAQKAVAAATTIKAKTHAEEVLSLALVAQAAEKARIAEEERLGLIERFTSAKQQGLKTSADELKSIQDQVKAQEESNKTIGLSAKELEALEISKIRDMAASKRRLAEQIYNGDGDSKEAENYRKAANELERLAALKEDGAMRKANQDAQKEIADEWEKTSKLIGKNLSDFIMGGGKDAAKYLKSLFDSLILQPVLQVGIEGLMGLFGGNQGNATGTAGGGSFIDRLRNSGGGFTNWSGWGGSAASTIGNWGNSLAGTSFEGLGTSLVNLGSTISEFDAWLSKIPGFEGGLGSVAGYATAIFSAFNGDYFSALGAAIGTYFFPGIGTMIGSWLGGLLDGLDGSGDIHEGAIGYFNSQQGAGSYQSGPNPYNTGIGDAMESIATGVGASFGAFLSSFGMDSAIDVRTNWLDDFDGEGGSWGNFSIAIQNAKGEWEDLVNWATDSWDSKWAPREFAPMEEGLEQYMQAVAQSYAEALKKVDLPSWAQDVLGTIAEDASIEDIASTLNQLSVMRATLTGWNDNLVEFAEVGDEAFGALLKSMGGFENLSAGVASFVDLYYSEQEKLDMAQKQLVEALSKFDLELPKLDINNEAMDSAEEVKAEWRKMVDAALAAGEEGAELAALLLRLGPSFAQYAEGAEAAAQAEADLAQARIDEQQRVIDELYSNAGINGDTIAQILRDGLLGRLTEEDVGAQLSNQIIDGIYNSLAGGFAQQITELFTSGIITPLLQAAATGSVMSGVVSQASIDAVVAQAQASVTALNAILNDPAIQEAIAQLKGVIGDLKIGTPTVPPIVRPTYSSGGSYSSGTATVNKSDSEREGLMRQLYKLNFDYGLLRKLEIDALQAGNRPLQERIYALQAQQQVEQRIASIDAELLKLSGDTEAMRALQLKDIAASLAQYMLSADQLNVVLEKQKELWAAQAVAATQNEFDNLWKQWLQTTNEAAALELERAALLSDTSRALFDQIKAYDKLKSAITSATGTLQSEIERLMDSITESAASTAYYESQFAILTAQARAGDTDAAAKLPRIVQALEKSVTEGAASEYEIRAAQFGYISSLEETQRILNGILSASGVYDPSGTGIGQSVKAPQVELINSMSDMTPALNAASSHAAELVTEVKSLREENALLRAEVRAVVAQSKRTADKLEQFGEEGLKVN